MGNVELGSGTIIVSREETQGSVIPEETDRDHDNKVLSV